MTELRKLENPELQKLFRKHIFRGVLFLIVLVAVIAFMALMYEDQINAFAHDIINQFGLYGLTGLVFFTDTIISPVPPDAALFFIGRSELHQSWWYLVPFLGFISTIAGVFGWMIGHKLKDLKYFQKLIDFYGDENKRSAKKFGFWLVVLGALTPLPFSLTCWLAGIFRMPFLTFFIASSFRIPRFVLYYWAIFYSSSFGSFLRSLMDFGV